jgi:hypothetical protein
MRKILLIAGAIASMQYAHAQAELTSWIMSTGYAQYTTGGPTITMSDSGDVQKVCYNSNFVYVEATGVAGTYTMGPWVGNPNTPGGKNYTFKLTRNPAVETGTKTAVPLFGSVGVAVNGVVFYGYGDARSYKASTGTNEPNGDGNWFSDAWIAEGSTMDASGNGHADQMSNYHYHANPIQLYSTAGTSHSPIIGFAYDGYPVYGPFGYTNPTNSSSGISRMVSGYELRNITDRTQLLTGPSVPAGPTLAAAALGTYIEDYEYTGNGDLDEYNGRYCVTPEYPGGTYAYFMSTKSNGDPAFPYLFAAEYYGEVDNTSTNNTMPGGLTCGVSTGLSDLIKNENEVDLFPNPANNSINLKFAHILPNEVLISNAMGQIVISTNDLDRIDISNLPQGIYNATILFESSTKTIRFIKQ